MVVSFCHLPPFSFALDPQVVPQVGLPDLPVRQLRLLGQAGEEQVEQLLVHVVAHLVQDEPGESKSILSEQ